jgi:hypothetical protein
MIDALSLAKMWSSDQDESKIRTKYVKMSPRER